jgi:hypothetical protein
LSSENDGIELYVLELLLAITSGILLSFTLSGATLTVSERCNKFDSWFAQDMFSRGYKFAFIRWNMGGSHSLELESFHSLELMNNVSIKSIDNDNFIVVDGKIEVPLEQCILVKILGDTLLIQSNRTLSLSRNIAETQLVFTEKVIEKLSISGFQTVLYLEYYEHIIKTPELNGLKRPLFSMMDSRWKNEIQSYMLELDISSSGIIEFLKTFRIGSGLLFDQFKVEPFRNDDSSGIVEFCESYIAEILSNLGKITKSPPKMSVEMLKQKMRVGFVDALLKSHLYLSIKYIRSTSSRMDAKLRENIFHFGETSLEFIQMCSNISRDLLSAIFWRLTEDDWCSHSKLDEIWELAILDPFPLIASCSIEPMNCGDSEINAKLPDLQSELQSLLTNRLNKYLHQAQNLSEGESSTKYYHHKENYHLSSAALALILKLFQSVIVKEDIRQYQERS